MADQAHEWTDEQINRLHRRLAREYSQAAMEMRTKLNSYLEDYGYANQSWKDAVRSGEATKEQYRQWLKSQSVRRDYLADMCDTLARDATRTNQLAADMINDELPRVYAENANYAAYGIESHLGRNTHEFDLVDQSTVRRLMGMTDDGQVIKEVTTDKSIVNPPLVTMRKLNLDEAKDVRWNRQKFNAALTQSILQGESIPNTAKRMARVLNMGQNMAVRAARTAMTSAENAGRVDSYQRAKRLGIDLEQEWLATLDERTRHSHRELDGQHVPVGEKFKVPSSGNELEFPADPTADPSEVWNCRCTLVAWFPEDGVESAANRFSRLPKDMTYDDWKAGKKIEKQRKDAAGVVDGKDILGTWQRREGEYEFAIRDVINAQGFDGKPRVVSADEFDAAVKAANGGQGFVAQRVYGAPNQEVLEGYRKELYEGSFFVDCSGGSTYGHGMYTASDFTGTVTSGIRSEMEYYENAGRVRTLKDVDAVKAASRMARDEARQARRSGDRELSERILSMENSELLERYGLYPKTYTETMTLDPSAKIIDYDTLSEKRREILEEHNAESYIYDLDVGTIAALLGYDAVDATRGRSGHYTVILNRTKLIIRRPE